MCGFIMGSLPNLDHVLDRREREKEKVLARERAREREFCHDLDSWRERVRLTIFSQQVAFNCASTFLFIVRLWLSLALILPWLVLHYTVVAQPA